MVIPADSWQPRVNITFDAIGKAEIWLSATGGNLTFRVQVQVTSSVPTVNLGVLLPMFSTEADDYAPVVWSPRVGIYQAIREINVSPTTRRL